MIWALFEITLPLFLAALFGLFTGWLLWRWRRRSISLAQWNSQRSSQSVEAGSLDIGNPDSFDTATIGKVVPDDDDRNSLVQKVTLLSQTNATQKVQLTALEKSATVLADELKTTRAQLLVADVGNTDDSQLVLPQNRELSAARAQISRLESRLVISSDTEKSLRLLQDKQAGWQLDNDQLQTKLHKAETRAAALAETNIKLSKRNEQKSADVKRGISIEKILVQKDARITELENELKSAADADGKQNAYHEAEDSQQRLSVQTSRVAELEQRLTEFEQNNSQAGQLQHEHLELQEKHNALQHKYSQLVAAKEKQPAVVEQGSEQTVRTVEFEKELGLVRKKAGSLEVRNKDLAEKLRAATRNEEELVQAKTQLATLQGQYRSVSSKADELDKTAQQASVLKTSLAHAQEESQSAKKELELVKQEQTKVKLQDSQSVQRLRELELQVQNSRNDTEELEKSKAQIHELTEQLAEATKKVEGVTASQQQIEQLEAKLVDARNNSLMNDNADAELKIAQLKATQLEAGLAQSEATTQELVQSREMIASLEKQIEEMYLDPVDTARPSDNDRKFAGVVSQALKSASNESNSLDDAEVKDNESTSQGALPRFVRLHQGRWSVMAQRIQSG